MQTLEMLEKLGAGAVVFLCVVLLVRQFIGAPRRERFDAVWRPSLRGLRRRLMRAWRWPAARRAARREAEAAIRRARGDSGTWEGNVYRAKSFRKSPRKLH